MHDTNIAFHSVSSVRAVDRALLNFQRSILLDRVIGLVPFRGDMCPLGWNDFGVLWNSRIFAGSPRSIGLGILLLLPSVLGSGHGSKSLLPPLFATCSAS